MPTGKRELEAQAIRQVVRQHAQARHGIFRRADLHALGIDPSSIRTFVRRGWWARLHHGVYVDAEVFAAAVHPVDRLRIQASAAIAALPGSVFTFGPTSAKLHGLAVDRPLLKTVSLVRPYTADQRALHRRIRTTSTLGSISIHRHALNPGHITIADGLPSVDILDAAISTAARSVLMWAVATLDSLLWASPDALEALHDRVESWSGLRGIGTVRRAAQLARHGAQNPFETISRLRFTQAGLPEPVLQLPVYDADGLIGNVDMAWLEFMVIGEADGLLKYENRSDLIAEKLREDRLRALGWIVVRWTWDELMRTPHVVIARIERAMRMAAARIA